MSALNNIKELVLDVNNIAQGAGNVIKKYFNSNFEVNYKQDKSPVTTADLAAHNYIAESLQKLTPELPLLSEESRQLEFAQRGDWNTYWLVDPLDGTREFIKNKPDFTVNIALIHMNVPVLGVIYLPIGDQLYFATEGSGSFKQHDNQAPAAISVSQLSDSLRICGSSAHPGKSMQKFLHDIGEHELISRGSSIKSCLVAEGRADIYPRFGPTWEWDTAAAQCIVEQAGGKLVDFDLNTLQYNKDSLLNPSFIAVGISNINWQKYLR